MIRADLKKCNVMCGRKMCSFGKAFLPLLEGAVKVPPGAVGAAGSKCLLAFSERCLWPILKSRSYFVVTGLIQHL